MQGVKVSLQNQSLIHTEEEENRLLLSLQSPHAWHKDTHTYKREEVNYNPLLLCVSVTKIR